MEATLEAKTARRSSLLLSKQQQRRQAFPTSSSRRRQQGRRRESWEEEEEEEDNGADSPGGSASASGGGDADGGRGTNGRWVRPRARRRTGALGERPGGVDADGYGDQSAAVVMAQRLNDELASCRKKLAEVTAEASRLRKEAKISEKDGGGRRDAQRQAGKQGTGGVERGGGRRAGRPGKACAVCGERSRSRYVRACVCAQRVG